MIDRIDVTGITPRFVSGKLLTFGRTFVQQGSNYAGTIRWLLNRTFSGETPTVAAVFVLSLFYVASQAAAVYALYWYAQQMQTDGVLSIQPLGIEWRAREEPVLLWVAITASAVCFITSASCYFLSRSLVMALVEKDLARGFTALVGFARRLPDPRAPVASRLVADWGKKGPISGCRFGALTALKFCEAVPPIVGAVGALGVLLWVDPALTILVLVAALLWSTLLYPLTHRAVRFANKKRHARAMFSAEAKEWLRLPSSSPVPAALKSAFPLAQSFLGKRRVSNEMKLLVVVGATICVAVAALFVAHSLMTRGSDWPRFVVYVGGLRLALAGFFQVTQTFASVSRFYPEIAAFVMFVQSAKRLNEDGLGFAQAGDAVVLGSLPDGRDVCVKCGDRIAVATVSEKLELQLAFICVRTAQSGHPLATAYLDTFATSSTPAPPIVIVDADALGAMARPAALTWLEELKDSVTLITYRVAAKVSAFEEHQLIVVDGGAITSFVPLGMESRAVLETYTNTCSHQVSRRPGVDLEKEDNDDDNE